MYAVGITPSDSGFGTYERSLYGGRNVRTIKEAAAHFAGYEGAVAIRDEALPSEDRISGLVYDEPTKLYAVEDENGDYIRFGIIR